MEELARGLGCYKRSREGYEEEELKGPGTGTYERRGICFGGCLKC